MKRNGLALAPAKTAKHMRKNKGAARLENDKIVQIFKRIFHTATLVSSFDLKLSFFSEKIRQASGRLSEMSAGISSASEEISASTVQVVQANTALSGAITQISQEAELLNQNTAQSNELLGAVKAENGQMLALSRDMEQSVQTLFEVIQKVNHIVAGINKISDQTKLLSFNASIEAARAGEAGRGFGVVAGEIKALSDTTRELTSSIDGLLREMNEASARSKENAAQTAASIASIGNKLEAVSDRMEQNTGALAEMTGNIANAATTSNEVNNALQEASAALESVNANLQVLTESAQQLNSVSQSIHEVAGSVQTIENSADEMAHAAGEMVSGGVYALSHADFIQSMQTAIQAHMDWVANVWDMADTMTLAPVQTDEHKCGFGHFYYAVRPSAPQLANLWDSVEGYHHDLHKKGEDILRCIQHKDRANAIRSAQEAKALSGKIIQTFEEIIRVCTEMEQTGQPVF